MLDVQAPMFIDVRYCLLLNVRRMLGVRVRARTHPEEGTSGQRNRTLVRLVIANVQICTDLVGVVEGTTMDVFEDVLPLHGGRVGVDGHGRRTGATPWPCRTGGGGGIVVRFRVNDDTVIIVAAAGAGLENVQFVWHRSGVTMVGGGIISV